MNPSNGLIGRALFVLNALKNKKIIIFKVTEYAEIKALIFCFCYFRFLNSTIIVLSFGQNRILISLKLLEM